MSTCARPARFALSAATAVLLFFGVPAAASAAQRLEEFDLPSTQGNVDVSTVALNKITSLKATVMLPDGYDADPNKRWPVLYLLQGIGDNSEAWAKQGSGDVTRTAKGLPAIVVMPEAGRGFLMDWWQNGLRNGPNWSRYFLDEVVPTIESRYRVLPGRQFHAIGGASMGGYGAMLLGGMLPGYFGTIVSMSGLVDPQSPDVQVLLPQSIGAPFATVWGPPTGSYAVVNNPIKVMSNVAGSRIYLSTGNGIPDPTLRFTPDSLTKGAAIEAAAFVQNSHYAALAATSGVNVAFRARIGVHDWPYWEKELPHAIAWNLFAAPPVASSASAKTWTFKTMAPHGNAWGIGFKFAALPTGAFTTIARSGQRITVGGGTGELTINPGAADADDSGNGTRPDCSFTAKIPFTKVLPAGC